jgi:hypothetical protein
MNSDLVASPSKVTTIPIYFIYFLWSCSPARAMASSSTKFLDYTQRRATVGRTPLDEWSARCRDLYLTTHKTDKQPCARWEFFLQCSGIGLSIVVCTVSYCMLWIFWAGKIRRLRSGANRTHDRSKRAAVDLRLRPRGRWNRHGRTETHSNSLVIVLFSIELRSYSK